MTPSEPRGYSFIDAARGPIMLIALGLLMAADQMGSFSIGQTWPALLVLFGLLKVAAFLGGRQA